MTDLSTQQHFQFRLTGVTDNTFDTQTKQNVKKRVEKILYLESPPDDAVLLSYVGSKELTPSNNLYIGDRSDSLYENSRVGKVQEFIGSAQPVSVRNTNFITTQMFNEADSGSIPLYFKHVLPLTIVAESVRIYDKDFNPISLDKYKLEIQQGYDEDTGYAIDPAEYSEYHLYNNLESSYNPSTGEYEVYFVQYTDNSGSTEVTITELLSNELAYKEATFLDIWSVTLELKPWVKAYQWDAVNLAVTYPLDSEFAVRYEENRRISVKEPVALDDIHPWFPRIMNGILRSGYAGYTMTYKIPEFDNQAFNPIEPYKLATRTGCIKIDDYLTKLPHEDLQSGLMFSYFYMLFERDGVVEHAVTNDPLTDGSEYRDFDNNRVLDSNGDTILWSADNLLGLDRLAGIAHVSFKIEDSYEILATYSYKEYQYELTSLNMNPVFDIEAHKELRAIYIVPETSINNNEGLQTQSIQWIKMSSSGKITSVSQDNGGGNPDISNNVELDTAVGYRLSGVVGMHYGWRATTTVSSYQEIIYSQNVNVSDTSNFPYKGWIRFLDTNNLYRYARYVDKTDTALVLSPDQDEIAYTATGVFVNNNTTIELVNFIDERTTLTSRDTDEVDYVPSGSIPVSYSRYFLLAEMSINPSHSHQDSVVIDVRKDGGGIDPAKYEEAKLLNPQAQWLSDFGDFDGQKYPGNAVIVIKLPVALLDTYTENQLYDIVEKSVPLGVKPIIRYYGYQPNLIVSGSGFVSGGFGDDYYGLGSFGV